MKDVRFLGDLSTAGFIDARVGGSLFADRAHFEGSVRCENFRVANNAVFRASTFDREASFLGMRSEGSVLFGSNTSESISAAVFNAEARFDRAHVGDNIDFEDVQFSDAGVAVSFQGIHVGGDLMFSGIDCAPGVTFAHCHVAGQAQFQGAIFRQRATFSGMTVDRSILFSANTGRNLPAAVFEMAARFHDLKVGSNADFSDVKFKAQDGEVRFDRARVAGNGRFNGTIFALRVVLSNVHVGGQLLFDNAEFQKECIFVGLTVAGAAFFRTVRLNSECKFTAAHFCSSVNFIGSRFGKNAVFARTVVDGDAVFNSDEGTPEVAAAFEGESDFTDACIRGNADFQAVAFRGAADFDSARIEKSAFFHGTVFDNGARFPGIHVAQDLAFNRAQFKAVAPLSSGRSLEDAITAGEVNFQGAEVIGDATFEGTVFMADTSFEDAVFNRGAYFDLASFRRGARPSFSGAYFKHGAFFRNATFHDAANFRVSHFGLEARFQGTRFHKRAIFDGAVFEGIAEFRGGDFRGSAVAGAVFNDVSFEHAHFEQDARFDDARFRMLVGFRETSFKALYLSPVGWIGRPNRPQFRRGIDLRGCQYDRIQASWETLLRFAARNRPSPWGQLVRPVQRARSRQEPYDRQPYIQMENVLRTSGRVEDADNVYLERRRVERRNRWQQGQYGFWLTDLLFGAVARYGVRPFRLIVFSLALLGVGTWFFSHPGTLVAPKDAQATIVPGRAPDKFELVAVSLHEFLPVDIPMGGQWVPAPDPVAVEFKWSPHIAENLASAHMVWVGRPRLIAVRPATVASLLLRIPGWILVPLGVAALAGILRRSA